MAKIAVIFNGGTISMKVDKRIQAAVPSLTGHEIMAMVTGIDQFSEIETYTFSSLPSPHMTPQLMFELSSYIQSFLDREDISGVVITHGTDTLEETAFFLDLTLKAQKPVVITGAMRNGSELGYDGPSNLAASICTAASKETIGRGVLVCFNGELYCASEVTKINSMSLNAFCSPNLGPIGIVDSNMVIFYRSSIRKQHIAIDGIHARVDLIKCVAGMDCDIVDYYLKKGTNGLIIEGTGRGNVPPGLVEPIGRAIASGVPVVVVSRCFQGRVLDSYGYPGGGKDIRNLGVIFGDILPGQKARIKLIVALSKTRDMDKIKKLFEKELY